MIPPAARINQVIATRTNCRCNEVSRDGDRAGGEDCDDGARRFYWKRRSEALKRASQGKGNASDGDSLHGFRAVLYRLLDSTIGPDRGDRGGSVIEGILDGDLTMSKVVVIGCRTGCL